MNTYDPARPCPKCGGHKCAVSYEVHDDLIHRICDRCQYHWPEWPLDRPPTIVVTNDHGDLPPAWSLPAPDLT